MILELFSCSGGMAEGLRRAGLMPDMAVDFDADHCKSYARNLGRAPECRDVRDLLASWVREELGIGSVDLLVADPPCTPWSLAGKRRGLADERDMLRATCDIIGAIRPTCWLVANVPGLEARTNAHVVDSTLRAIGYEVDYFRLDAADYGVPQRRRRPFWFGRERGTAPLLAPEPTHIDPMRYRSLFDLTRLPWVTCAQALGHLPLEELGRPVRMSIKPRADGSRSTPDHAMSNADAPARTQTGNTHSDGAVLRRAHEPSDPDRPAMTVTARARGGFGGGGTTLRYKPSTQGPQSGRVGVPDEPACTVDSKNPRVGAGASSVLAWPWDRPSTVVTTDARICGPGHQDRERGKSFLSDANAIVLSERARLILQGFPESWHIAGTTKKKRSAAIGMAMPPPMAEAVGRQIAAWMRRHAGRRAA